MRVDCLRSRLPPRAASLRVVEALRVGSRGGKRSSRHRSGTCKTHLIATPMHPRQVFASRSARNFQETFRCAKTCPASSVLFPLTHAVEGVRAWQAKRRRTGAGARAAPIPQASRLVEGQEKGTEMKEYEVYSDAGGILVGTRDCRVHIPNAYGDGTTKVRVFDSKEEFEPYRGTKSNLEFVTTVCGNRIEIPDYDCPSKEPWFDGTVHDWTPIVTLDGCYAVYAHDGEIDFERWGDAREV